MKKLFKRIACVAFASLFFYNALSLIGLNKEKAVAETASATAANTEVSAQEEKNFYETSLDIVTFPAENARSGAVAAVYDLVGYLVDDSVQYRVNEGKVYVSNVDSEKLVLGKDYILRLTYSDEEIEIPFMYVTKALRTVEDLSIFDIDVTGKIIKGYYALANDINAGYEKRILDHKGYSKTGGFEGTFDGLGNRLTFRVGNVVNESRVGLFGFLRGGAVIKNTAFVDIWTDSCAILAKASNALSGSQVTVSNCYFSVYSGFLCLGAILENGQVWVKLQNVIIDWPGVLFNAETSGQTYSGAIFARYINRGHAKSDEMMKNVYVISKAPLAFSKDANYETKYYIYYAKNDRIAPSPLNGIYIFNNVKRYKTGAEMLADTSNSYKSFSDEYWDLSVGIPVFKSALKSAIGVAIDGENINRKVLYTSSMSEEYETSAKIVPAILGAPIPNVDANYEILSGGECVSIEESTGVVTAIKEGKTKIKLSYTYDGDYYEEILTLTIKTPAGSTSDSEGGCSSSVLENGALSALVILGATIALILKRKKA